MDALGDLLQPLELAAPGKVQVERLGLAKHRAGAGGTWREPPTQESCGASVTLHARGAWDTRDAQHSRSTSAPRRGPLHLHPPLRGPALPVHTLHQNPHD